MGNISNRGCFKTLEVEGFTNTLKFQTKFTVGHYFLKRLAILWDSQPISDGENLGFALVK